MPRLVVLSLVMLALIIVPFLLWGDAIERWANAFVQSGAGRWQAAAIIAALLAADIVLPVPSSLLSTAAGVLLGFALGSLTSWIGMTAGCVIGYRMGLHAPAGRLLGEVETRRVKAAADRFGDWTLVLFRAVPVLAEASVFFAGLTAMPAGRFLTITSLSNLGISAAYAATGAWFGGRENFLMVFAGAIGIPACALLIARLFLGSGQSRKI